MDLRQTYINEIPDNESLQLLINITAEQYRNPVWPRFFDWKYTNQLNWTAYTGVVRNAVAATVMAYEADAPLRTRQTVFSKSNIFVNCKSSSCTPYFLT